MGAELPAWRSTALRLSRHGREALRARVLQITTDTYIARFGDFSYIARFRIASAPYAVVAKAHVLPDDASVSRYELVLRTSVPESLPSLVLRPQTLLHGLGQALHVVREIELGDPSIDDAFWITGSAASSAVLTAAVRAALIRLGSCGPVLRLGNGMATRYGCSVGKSAKAWTGEVIIKKMKEWPNWIPAPYHIGHKPELAKWLPDGMPGAARTIRWGQGPCIFTRARWTPSTASTAP